MQIFIQDDFFAAAHITTEQVRLSLAVGLFAEERLTLAQAAHLAGLDFLAFQRHLASHHIPLHYGEQELNSDLESLKARGILK